MNKQTRNILIVLGIVGILIFAFSQTIFKSEFTIYGTDMQCSSDADDSVNLNKGDKYYFSTASSVCGGKSFFLNYFRGQLGDDEFQKEYYYRNGKAYITAGSGEGSIFLQSFITCDASSYWDEKCYVQIYCCPTGACESNSDCPSSKPKCSFDYSLSDLFPQFGVCQTSVTPTHKTKVYLCSNGQETYIKEVSAGDKSWCSDETKNRYLISTGEETGVCYTSSNKPPECKQEANICWRKVGNTCTEVSTYASCSSLGYYDTYSACSNDGGDDDGGDDDGDGFFGNGLTISEFLSAGPVQVAHSVCIDSCNPKEGYTVTCDKDFNKYIFKDIEKESCELFLGSLKAIPIAGPLVTGFVCKVFSGSFDLYNSITPLGVCVAEPDNTFSKYYNGLLKEIYKLGVPRGWVIPIVIIVIIIMAILLISLLK